MQVYCVVLEVTISANIIKTPSCATKLFYGCGLRMRAESALIDNDRIFSSGADYGIVALALCKPASAEMISCADAPYVIEESTTQFSRIRGDKNSG